MEEEAGEPVPHDEIPTHLARASVVCQPSLLEPLGQSLLEGMATGRSVVPALGCYLQMLRPGEKINLFKLGEGPFPLPIGQELASLKQILPSSMLMVPPLRRRDRRAAPPGRTQARPRGRRARARRLLVDPGILDVAAALRPPGEEPPSDFLDNYDARFVIVTNGPIEEALAYKAKVGNKMDWYSSSESSFGADVGAPPGAGFAVNVFLRDGDKVYRTWHTDGRGTEQLSYTFALIDILPWGRQEEWQDSPDGWPKSPTYSKWLDSPDVARLYGPK
jgi:hypothetical protein